MQNRRYAYCCAAVWVTSLSTSALRLVEWYSWRGFRIETEEDTVDDRLGQVGDPFGGKKLMEACLSYKLPGSRCMPGYGRVRCDLLSL